MSKTVTKRVGVALAVVAGSAIMLGALVAALVVNGALTMEQAPLWALRIVPWAIGLGVLYLLKTRKTKRKKRGGSHKRPRKRSVT